MTRQNLEGESFFIAKNNPLRYDFYVKGNNFYLFLKGYLAAFILFLYLMLFNFELFNFLILLLDGLDYFFTRKWNILN